MAGGNFMTDEEKSKFELMRQVVNDHSAAIKQLADKMTALNKTISDLSHELHRVKRVTDPQNERVDIFNETFETKIARIKGGG